MCGRGSKDEGCMGEGVRVRDVWERSKGEG